MAARDIMTLRVCTFRGLQNLPLYAARARGLFAAAGLDVAISYTQGSAPQIAGLAAGAYEIIQTAPDNVVNATLNPAAFGLDAVPGIVLVMGGSVGPLGLFAQSDIDSFERLRGGACGVDNPTSGFALVLRDLMARHGLTLDRDYSVVPAGGTSERLAALQSGRVAATILYAPYDALAAAASFTRLALSSDYYPAYASLATAVTRPWARLHGAVLIRYLAAVMRALRWIHQPGNAAVVEQIMQTEPELDLDAATAGHALAAFTDPTKGFGLEAALDEDGLRQVIDLRAAYGDPAAATTSPRQYCDRRWYDEARAVLDD